MIGRFNTRPITKRARALVATVVALSAAAAITALSLTTVSAAPASNTHSTTVRTLKAMESAGVEYNPSKVVGSKSCAECHAPAVESWKQTPHFQTWSTLHRKDAAREIASKMGVRSIKRGDVCLQCHYTRQKTEDRIRPISGVSCESCHGPAKDWMDIHNDFGGEGVTKEQETAEHRKMRIQKSVEHGMRHPSNLYAIAQNCYNCHTVPNEKLVNTGGHQAGSEGFELVAWSQGMVRHNFARTNQQSNAENSPERLRKMYVVGAMVDLEYSLRALSKATQRAQYAVSMAQRVDAARKRLKKIQGKIDNAHVKQAVEAGFKPALKLNNEKALSAAADTTGEAARAFAKNADGSTLEALDPMLPESSEYKGEPLQP